MACTFCPLGAQSRGRLSPIWLEWSPNVPLGRRTKMKNQIFITLLSSMVLALPGFAQQTNSTAAPATGSAPQSASDREPIPADTPTNFWDGDDPNLVNLVTHPFASKKYVQRHVAPIRDRINELDQLTSENSKSIKDVDSRATQGLQMASEKTSRAVSSTLRSCLSFAPTAAAPPTRSGPTAARPSQFWKSTCACATSSCPTFTRSRTRPGSPVHHSCARFRSISHSMPRLPTCAMSTCLARPSLWLLLRNRARPAARSTCRPAPTGTTTGPASGQKGARPSP